MLSYLQKVGRALMVPVAALPAAAILMGLGYWIDPSDRGGSRAGFHFVFFIINKIDI